MEASSVLDPAFKSLPCPDDPLADKRSATHAFLCVFVFLLLLAYASDQLQTVWTGSQSIREQLSLDGRKSLAHRWWTPLTYSFVHFNHVHLALNLGAVALFGYGLGRDWPWHRVALLTLLAGLGGATLWWAFHHGQRNTVIGSSAIASGYITAFILARPKDGIPIIGTRWSFPRWILLVLLFGIEGRGLWLEAKSQVLPQAVSHSAHMGGIIAAVAITAHQSWHLRTLRRLKTKRS